MMKASSSQFVDVRGLRYHVRSWGDAGNPKLVMLHGWMDVSASFQFLVDALGHDWNVLAPDLRGFGLTQWAAGGYWFPDYLADLDVLLDAIAPEETVNLLGHSMGGNVAGLYAGIRPALVKKLALLEGWGLGRADPAKAPTRYTKWLDELRETPGFRPYRSFAEVAQRLRDNNPRLTLEQANFLAPHWARETGNGDIVLRSDPRHKLTNPISYRLDEAMACWRQISAPTLWVSGDGQWAKRWIRESEQELDLRRACYADLTETRIAEAGHMMHHDAPERLAGIVEEFFHRNQETS